MISNRPSTPWARAEDWAKHRTTITDMFVNRRMKVKAIMQTMEEDHGFHATRRMYRTRFKKWGLARNIRTRPPLAFLDEDVSASGASSEAEQESRPVTGPRARVRQIPNHASSIHSVQILQQLWKQSAIRSMPPPDCYRLAEDTLQRVHLYVSTLGLLDLGVPVTETKLVTAVAGAEWLNYVTTAGALLGSGHFERAVSLIDVCCHQYRSLLHSHDPSLMPLTVAAIQRVLRYWPALAAAFLNFVYKMSGIVLGIHHPLSTLFHSLREAGTDHLAYCLGTTNQHLLGGLVHVMPHPMMETYGDTYHDLIQGRLIDTHTLKVEVQALEHRFQGGRQAQPQKQSAVPEETTTVQCRLAWLYFHGGRYEDATEFVLGMLSKPGADPRVAAGCYDILHSVAMAQKNYDYALDMIKKAIETSVEAFGYAHPTTTGKMVRLESCLRSMDRVPEAEKVHSDWDMQLTQICDKARKLRL